jgi:hypothetical protein
MAFNTAALKGLFSKLKPAAKTVANYGDDVASAVANYGDDVAKALTTYGDDAARMAFANADDLAAATAQTDDIADIISKERPLFSSAPVEDPVIWDNDYLEWYGDKGINTDFRLNGARTLPENTDELITHLNNADAEFDSLSQLDPDAYKSTMTNAPAFRNNIAPEEFGGYGGYDNRLVGSFQYPDGFINPDSAAMYYDSLERGYVPMEYAKESRRIHDSWARSDAARHAEGVPGLYDYLQRKLGPAAFTSPNKSEQFLQNLNSYRPRRRR